METKVFVFEQMGFDLVERPEGGSGTVRKFDDYREKGWRPLHWESVPAGQSQIVRFRVVMEREKRDPLTEVM